MEARAVAATLDGTTWLVAQTIGKLQNPDATNPHVVTSWRKEEGKIFPIKRAGQTWYSRYIFGDLGRPIPAIAEILQVSQDDRPFRIASWFASTNSELHGKRLLEVLERIPLRCWRPSWSTAGVVRPPPTSLFERGRLAAATAELHQ
ncbi:hypothetical protein R69776_04658 [Paraburkholderia nemoris]|uniref:Uncharacterized protein n=1 Tax=Paraburkholderia nemoris TaxID=2793076 RepID=A0ABN7M7R8_9BURK|nr:hypothetical protein R69776_04658 [Paraburkholderia nemoris]